MRMVTTVIYTDKLAEVKAFYQRYFSQLLSDTRDPHTFNLRLRAEAQISWIDAAWAEQPVTSGTTLRATMSYTEIEHAALVEKDAPCSQLSVADWGPAYNGQVQYFTVVDPSGTRIVYYEDQIGEKKQLMTIGDGTGTKAIQKAHKTADTTVSG
ncbi:MAG: hypothetical protein ACYDBJ_11610 [Aggregatilineales bacterium]